MPVCCAPGCNNNRGNANKSFYQIPKSPVRREKWIRAIKRARKATNLHQKWNPKGNGLVLCSDHFIAGAKSQNPLSPDYIPSIFHHVTSSERKRLKLVMEEFNRKQAVRMIKLLEQTRVSSSFKPGNNSAPLEETCDHENYKSQVESLEQEFQRLKAENQLLKEKVSKTELDESILQNDNKQVLTLTGLPTFSILRTLFNIICPYLKHRSDLTSFQQFLLTLVKLRMNISFDFLAFYFNIDSTTASKVFKHCIGVMYLRLAPSLIVWPDRETLWGTLPNAFRSKDLGRTACIVGCLEISVEKPSVQSNSTSKSHHAFKYLIAITPQGSICFISNGWGGRTSGKFILENSNFLSHLLQGDLVLADRSFNAKQSCSADGKIPAFTLGNKQLDPIELKVKRTSDSLKLHMERVVRVVCQKYALLQSAMPAMFSDFDKDNNVMYLDKIVKVCCALTNMCESIVPYK